MVAIWSMVISTWRRQGLLQAKWNVQVMMSMFGICLDDDILFISAALSVPATILTLNEECFQTSVCWRIQQWGGALPFSLTTHQLVWLSLGVISSMPAKLSWYLAFHLVKSSPLHLCFVKWDYSIPTISLGNLYQNTMVTWERVQCFTLNINKLGWMLESVIWMLHLHQRPEFFYDASFNIKSAQQFQYWFDIYCKHAFINCMHDYDDYTQPILVTEVFMNYLLLSKQIFPLHWEFLACCHGISARDSEDLQDYMESQVFMILLNLQRFANFWSLKHIGQWLFLQHIMNGVQRTWWAT